MFQKHKITIILTLIVVIAAFLRLWQIGHIPISPDWDEAAYGYNAYSVIHTGKDEFGASFPVVLRSFDDYKPALYLYLVIPFVALLGVTTEAVRLPSAIAGIVAVYFSYLLVKQLLKRNDIALLAAFLLAISPWHIQFSRIAFEANVGVLLNMSMLYFFLRGLNKPKLLIVAAICGGLSLYAYQSEKVFTPLLALTLVGVYWGPIRKIQLKYLLAAIVVGLIVVAPMGTYLITNSQSLTRARETSIFADKDNLTRTARRLDTDTKSHDYAGLILDNRRIFYGVKIIDGYLSHFSLNWLFIEGDNNPRHHAPAMSLLYLWELPFLLIGIYLFVFSSFDKRAKLLLFLWFLLAPVPASVTSGVPHAVRTINFLPLFQILTSVGLLGALQFIQKYTVGSSKYKAVTILLYTVFFILATYNLSYFFNQYFSQMNYFTARDWQYGYEKIVPYVASISSSYDKIIVENREPLDQSYIFFLFYLRFSPQEYQRLAAENSSGGFAESHSFGKYVFRPIQWTEEKEAGKVLYIGRPMDFPKGVHVMKTVKYPNGEEAMLVVEKNK